MRHRIGHGTKFPDGQAGSKEFRSVGQRDGGKVAVAQAQFGIGAGESIGPGLQLCTRELRAACRSITDQHDSLRRGACQGGQHTAIRCYRLVSDVVLCACCHRLSREP